MITTNLVLHNKSYVSITYVSSNSCLNIFLFVKVNLLVTTGLDIFSETTQARCHPYFKNNGFTTGHMQLLNYFRLEVLLISDKTDTYTWKLYI